MQSYRLISTLLAAATKLIHQERQQLTQKRPSHRWVILATSNHNTRCWNNRRLLVTKKVTTQTQNRSQFQGKKEYLYAQNKYYAIVKPNTRTLSTIEV